MRIRALFWDVPPTTGQVLSMPFLWCGPPSWKRVPCLIWYLQFYRLPPAGQWPTWKWHDLRIPLCAGHWAGRIQFISWLCNMKGTTQESQCAPDHLINFYQVKSNLYHNFLWHGRHGLQWKCGNGMAQESLCVLDHLINFCVTISFQPPPSLSTNLAKSDLFYNSVTWQARGCNWSAESDVKEQRRTKVISKQQRCVCQ